MRATEPAYVRNRVRSMEPADPIFDGECSAGEAYVDKTPAELPRLSGCLSAGPGNSPGFLPLPGRKVGKLSADKSVTTEVTTYLRNVTKLS